jgi:cytochrome oxidase Cu insertion factor (SCO1/SenC/PrrC family)
MSTHGHVDPVDTSSGYEKSDARLRPLIEFTFALALLIAVSIFSMKWLFWDIDDRVEGDRSQAGPMENTVAAAADAALQANPSADLLEFRAQQLEATTTYGWSTAMPASCASPSTARSRSSPARAAAPLAASSHAPPPLPLRLPRLRADRRLGVRPGDQRAGGRPNIAPCSASTSSRTSASTRSSGHAAAGPALPDESGKEVALGSFFGDRPVILSFVYYECPMLCTEVLNEQTRMLRVLALEPGKDFQIVTVSIDPRDKPELAAKKKANQADSVKRAGISEAWHFLCGDQEAITRADEGGRVPLRLRRGAEAVRARRGLMIVTPKGQLRATSTASTTTRAT